MPMYDFECGHGHRFERVVSMEKRGEPIPCEGTVKQLMLEDEPLGGCKLRPCPSCDGAEEAPPVQPVLGTEDVNARSEREALSLIVAAGLMSEFPTRQVPCALKAHRIISHSNPEALLDHGLCANRDAAREGRYDPLRPSTRGVRK